MTQIHRTRSLAATAAAAALTLTACGGGDSSSPDSPSGDGGQQGGSASQGKASQEKDGAGETVTAKTSKVSFEVPRGWESVDVADKEAAKNPPKWLEDAAKQQKVEPKEILQAWGQSGMEVVIAGDASLTKSISVANLPEMPSESQLKSQLKEGGAKVESPEKVKTSVGTGYTVASADKKANQTLLVLPADKGAAVIQVVSDDASSADKVSTTITDSIKKA
ncbi:hypothetical protein [Janibacter sp. GS2]|uniref:hypothetical protein n=1 Tax=Janibacter sp. GS2 TaxID=3442646 RepID=UPI003EB743AF